MLVKSKQTERNPRWRRPLRAGHGAESASHSAESHTSAPQSHSVPVPSERRHGGPSQDRALYACECGYAFEALVTTSVGCPHCARTQAW
jgi:hypothetical protein